MAYRFLDEEPVEAALRRIAGEQIDQALSELEDDHLSAAETVHQVRKRCKKVRGLLRLVRPAMGDTYAAENAHFRDAARLLSDSRDAAALLETYDALMKRFAGQVDRASFAPVRRALSLRCKKLTEEHLDLDERLAEFHHRMQIARERSETWMVDGEEFDALAGGLMKTYARGRNAMIEAVQDPTDEKLHEWRKRVKYHWYHARLLRKSWHPMQKVWRKEMKRLSDFLGDDHDLAVFQQTVQAEPDRFASIRSMPALLGLLARRRAELQAEARTLGMRLYAENPKALSDRLEAYWQAWRLETEATHTDADVPLIPQEV